MRRSSELTIVVASRWPAETAASLSEAEIFANRIGASPRFFVAHRSAEPPPAPHDANIVRAGPGYLDLGCLEDAASLWTRTATRSQERSAGPVLFVNDQLARYEERRPMLRVASKRLLDELPERFIAGRRLDWGEAYSIGPHTAVDWIQSHSMLMDRRTARELLDERVFRSPLASSISFEDGALCDPSGVVDRALLDRLTEGLIRNEHPEPGGWHWSKAQSLEATNAEFIVEKARTIVCERLITAVAVESGATIHDLIGTNRITIRDRLAGRRRR